jgi:hypothetical protein
MRAGDDSRRRRRRPVSRRQRPGPRPSSLRAALLWWRRSTCSRRGRRLPQLRRRIWSGARAGRAHAGQPAGRSRDGSVHARRGRRMGRGACRRRMRVARGQRAGRRRRIVRSRRSRGGRTLRGGRRRRGGRHRSSPLGRSRRRCMRAASSIGGSTAPRTCSGGGSTISTTPGRTAFAAP